VEIPTPLVLNLWLWYGLIAYWLIAALFTLRTKSGENFFLGFSHIIPLGAAYYLIFNRHRYFFLGGELYNTGWNNWIVYPGMLATVVGITFTLWARIHLGRYWSGAVTIKRGHKVIQTGPYAIVRHPVYTGWLTGLFGSALVAGTIDGFLGLELAILGFAIKLQREEKLLAVELGDEYRKYSEKVPATLFPGINTVGNDRSEIESEAFNQAVFRSDRYRALGILGVFAVFFIINAVSAFIYPEDSRRYVTAVSWYAALAVYEGILLAIAFQSARQGHPIRTWVWVMNAAIECVLPSIAILALTGDKQVLGPYKALVSSSLLLYPLFIILSTLRLNPLLSIVSGTTASACYLGAFYLTLRVAPNNQNRHMMPDRTYYFNALLLFAAGLVAALVAQQIRRHVIAALAEAETRRKLDRIEYDLRTARAIQMGLLPKSPPQVAGYDIAGFSEPADQTGGDYYDWMELPDGRVMFTIADATGHGIGPALLVAACRAYFRALANRDDPLEKITSQVDALLAADVTDGRFITAAVAILDPAKNLLHLYSAGHAPLFLYVASKDEVEVCDADQPPLGVCSDANGQCKSHAIQFGRGDALVLVTDGFYEHRNDSDELLGAERLIESIRIHHALPATEQIARLRQTVREFAHGTAQGDDTTAVIIRRTQEIA
jgi:serine phosphatase RsbU (regulator of sigma subunit)/protein-S-isoprenylcysteine O-methyltransferase Ste14